MFENNKWSEVRQPERQQVMELYETKHRQGQINCVPGVSFQTITCEKSQKRQLSTLAGYIYQYVSGRIAEMDEKDKFYFDIPIFDSQDGKNSRIYFVSQSVDRLEGILDKMVQDRQDIKIPTRRHTL